MMSTESIIALAREQAVRAFVEEREPYVPEVGEPDRWSTFPIPNLGSYQPAGWRLEEHVLVDKTGWGIESEPALTVRGFKQWVAAKQAQYPGAGFALIEEGQFQVVVGIFVPDPDVEGDTFEVEECYNCGDFFEAGEEYCPSCGERVDGLVECDTCYKAVDPDDIHDGMCRECLPFRPGDEVEWDSAGETFTGTVEAYTFSAETLVVITHPDLREVEVDFEDARPAYNPLDDENQIQLPVDL